MNAMHKELEALRDQLRYAAENAERLPLHSGGWVSAEFISVMADKLDALLREGGWQPIETAPKDGVILLAVAGGSEVIAFVAEASHEDHGMVWCVTHGWTGWVELHSAWAPVGWQPLPEPPAITGDSR